MARARFDNFAWICQAVSVLFWPNVAQLRYWPAPIKLYRPIVSVVAALSNKKDNLDFAFAEILRYMLDGVRNSAGMEAKTGTRLGGLGDVTAAARIWRTVSSEG